MALGPSPQTPDSYPLPLTPQPLLEFPIVSASAGFPTRRKLAQFDLEAIHPLVMPTAQAAKMHTDLLSPCYSIQPIFLLVRLCVCLCLSGSLGSCLSVFLSVCLSVCLSVLMPVCIICLSFNLFVLLSEFPSDLCLIHLFDLRFSYLQLILAERDRMDHLHQAEFGR